jgi:hypothetical protein
LSDDVKDAATALLSLLLIAGFVHYRAEHAIVHDVARTVQGGRINSTVNGAGGGVGLLAGQADSVLISGSGFKSDGFRFKVQRGSGIRAAVRRLRFSFTDFTLKGIPVRSYTSVIPNVSIDTARAFFDERIILRSAGEGTGEATVGNEALSVLFARKFPQYKNVKIELHPGAVNVAADALAVGIKVHIESASKVALSEGRYVRLTESQVTVNGKPATPQFVESIYKAVNPVVDTNVDLGLGGYFFATELELGEGTLKVRGRAMIPAESPKSAVRSKSEPADVKRIDYDRNID